MAIDLTLNGNTLPLTADKYTVAPKTVEERYVSEAGTNLRIIRRAGIPSISVAFTTTEETVAILDGLVQLDYLTAQYWDEQTSAIVSRRMFIDPDSYEADLKSETNLHRYYRVAFTLVDIATS